MTVSLSWVVMAHPKRAEWAEQLAAELECGIVWDTDNTVWHTGRAALEAHGNGTHHVVIQDDTLLHPRLKELSEQAAVHAGERPVALYLGSRRDAWATHGSNVAKANGCGFLAHGGPIWGPGVITPVGHIPAIVQHGDKLRSPAYDRKMMDYWRLQRIDCYYTVPSLVNHRPVTENPSLVDVRRTGNRHAYLWDTKLEPDFSRVQPSDFESLFPTVYLLGPNGRRYKVREGSSQHKRFLAKGMTVDA